jgi:FAD/FMN-containing dehydrogenase
LSYLAWQGAEQDALFREAGKALEERIDEYARSVGADTSYLYFNYADKAQDPLSNYGAENISKMKAAAKKYDPSGVFQELVPGGFKISNVQ